MYLRSIEEMRRRLADIIFDEQGDSRGFVELGSCLGFDPVLPRIAIVIDLRDGDADAVRHEGVYAVLAQSLASYMRLSTEQLVYVARRGKFVAWVPWPHGNSILQHQRPLSEALNRFAKRTMQVQGIGVGLANEGLRGWTLSAREAMSALGAVRDRRGYSTKVLFYSDIVIDKSICSNESALRYFEMLLEALIHEKDLIRTLQSYFDNRQHRKATAAELNIHPNTLAYRLNRIEMLLDADLNAPSWIARLFMALKLHEEISADTHQRRAAASDRLFIGAKVCEGF